MPIESFSWRNCWAILFLFYECGMRMRSRGGAKLVIITWRADVLKMWHGQLAVEIAREYSRLKSRANGRCIIEKRPCLKVFDLSSHPAPNVLRPTRSWT